MSEQTRTAIVPSGDNEPAAPLCAGLSEGEPVMPDTANGESSYASEKERLIHRAASQIHALNHWEGGSLRLGAFQVRDTMQALIDLVDGRSSR